jgi:hypothetical protein
LELEVRFEMASRKSKKSKSKIRVLAAAAAAVALVTTLALARTAHTPTPAAHEDHASAAHGKVIDSNPSSTKGSRLHGILTCGETASATDCENLNTWLPMSLSTPDNLAKAPVWI